MALPANFRQRRIWSKNRIWIWPSGSNTLAIVVLWYLKLFVFFNELVQKSWETIFGPFCRQKNGNCHKSTNIAKGTLIFGSSTKWISRVIWPFIKIFCLLFKILGFGQNKIKTSGSPQTWLGKKICPKLSWILFFMLKWSCTAISVMGFWILGEKLNFEDFFRLP